MTRRQNAAWYEALRPLCVEVRADLRSGYPTEVVLFYLARWCQKKSGRSEPSLASLELREVADQIVLHLAKHGDLVDRVVAGDRAAEKTLRGYVARSARSRLPDSAARYYTDEALQRIALVLLTGTSPSQAAERLLEGPRGPSNEYVFESPFPSWAQTIVINMIKDGWREGAGQGHVPRSKPAVGLDRELVLRARAALPALLEAIRDLPRLQKEVIVLSLSRSDVDPVAREGLLELAPDLFADTCDASLASDRDIADRMSSTPHNVAANRSAARCKLAARHEDWAVVLDLLLPHKSTRRAKVEADA